MHYVYVLWSEKLRKRYIGSTGDIQKRLNEHNSGHNKFTKGGKPWELVYSEVYSSKTEALIRERFLKSGAGRSWLDKLPSGVNSFRRGAGVV
jgi:putative endonuclease